MKKYLTVLLNINIGIKICFPFFYNRDFITVKYDMFFRGADPKTRFCET